MYSRYSFLFFFSFSKQPPDAGRYVNFVLFNNRFTWLCLLRSGGPLLATWRLIYLKLFEELAL